MTIRWLTFSTALLLVACNRPSPDDRSVEDLFSTAYAAETLVDDGWARALQPRTWAFPADHAAHEDHRIEWWYYTGNLQSQEGRKFGYQLTFFRTGIHREPRIRSPWAVRDLYTAHFAVSDISHGEHEFFQRNNRQGVGWAGASSESFEVWNGNWRVWMDGETHRLVAQQADWAIDLSLVPTRAPRLHGESGLSRKGPTEGNASHYYSHTRMVTSGTVVAAGRKAKVQGNSWMDHEFSSSFLEPGQVGWDWFALQLDNDQEIMLYQMRRSDGSADPFSSGTLIDAEGRANALSKDDFSLTPLDTWRSVETGAEYPLNWRIEIPRWGYSLRVRPAFAQQEMHTAATTSLQYWEGSIGITGRQHGKTIQGVGYLELTGYSGRSLGALFD